MRSSATVHNPPIAKAAEASNLQETTRLEDHLVKKVTQFFAISMDSALTTKKGEQHRKCIAVPIAHFEKELTGPELFRIRVVASISDGGATNRSFINAHFPVDRSQGTTDISNEPALSRTFVLHLGSSPPCEEAAKQPLQ